MRERCVDAFGAFQECRKRREAREAEARRAVLRADPLLGPLLRAYDRVTAAEEEKVGAGEGEVEGEGGRPQAAAEATAAEATGGGRAPGGAGIPPIPGEDDAAAEGRKEEWRAWRDERDRRRREEEAEAAEAQAQAGAAAAAADSAAAPAAAAAARRWPWQKR